MLLRQLSELEELKITPVAGGPGLDRPIRWVYTTDLLDPTRYLRGDELVLTSGLWYSTDADCARFVRALSSRGVAGLVFGVAVTGSMPQELVDACTDAELPLFTVPVDVSFGAISEAVIGEISAERDARLARSMARHRQLIRVIADGSGLGGLARFLADELGIECHVISSYGRELAATSKRLSGREALLLCQEAAQAPRLPAHLGRHDVSVFKLDRPGEPPSILGYLICESDYAGWPTEIVETVDVIRNLVAIEVNRTDGDRQRDAARAQDFFRALSEARLSRPEIRAEARALGVPVDLPLVAVAAREVCGNGEDTAALLAYAAELVGETPVAGAFGGNAFAILANTSHEQFLGWMRELAGVRARNDTLALGVSHVGDAAALTELMDAATLACDRSAESPEPLAIARSDELSTYAALVTTIPRRVRETFAAGVLGPLLDYDCSHNSDLIKTLEVLLQEQSPRAAATRLQIHINTLRYRLRRIAELTGKNLAVPADRADLLLALRCAA